MLSEKVINRTRPLQWVSDQIVLACVAIWMVARAPRQYLRLVNGQIRLGTFPVRVADPRTANEKFFWRKDLDHNPLFARISDKQGAKEWIAETGIAVECPKTLWVGTDLCQLPDVIWSEPFYLKATHGWNTKISVTHTPEDRSAIIAEATSFLTRQHGHHHLEWAYLEIPPRLMAERSVGAVDDMIEVKCFTYGPIVEFFLFLRRRPPGHGARWDLVDDGKFHRCMLPTSVNDEVDMTPLPPMIDDLLAVASQIGSRFDHMRVDFLTDGTDFYLGELTVYHNAGVVYRQGHLQDAHATRSWDLRQSWFMAAPQTGWRAVYAKALRRKITQRNAARLSV